jgi:hypothetical protein
VTKATRAAPDHGADLLVTGDDEPMWTAAATAGPPSCPVAGRHGRGARHLPALEAPAEVIALTARFWTASSSDHMARTLIDAGARTSRRSETCSKSPSSWYLVAA